MGYKIKKICCIGAGYVGGPTMAVIADKCPDIEVTLVDLNKERISAWNNPDLSKLPIYEPGLDKIVQRCRHGNLHFQTEIEKNISSADMIFLSVNTPTKNSGIGAGQASDLKWIEASARQVAAFANGETIVVEKSTVPVKTAQTVKKILEASSNGKGNRKFSVLSNPEFLAEGTAINDLNNPDRILIGGDDSKAIDALSSIYETWVDKNKILKTNLWSSELSKLTSNAFLAQRISSINSIATLCEATGADVNEVAEAIGMDSRIGSEFLKAGPGFGGSCFKKDILNLVYLCNYYGLNEIADYWLNIVNLNIWHQHRISKLIVDKLFGTVTDKKIGILGFSFKANTNDIRESPAIQISIDLLEEGAKLCIYDPKVKESQIENVLKSSKFDFKLNTSWTFVCSSEEAAIEADALIVITEWDEFKNIDWGKISKLMRKPAWLIDTRNITNKDAAKSHGINIWNLGSNS